MMPNPYNLQTMFLGLALLGILSGCTHGALIVGEVAGGVLSSSMGQPDPEPWRTGENRYEPVILVSNSNMIRIKYLSIGPNAEHQQVKQLMSDHCHGAYTETSRVELRGYETVEAECTI